MTLETKISRREFCLGLSKAGLAAFLGSRLFPSLAYAGKDPPTLLFLEALEKNEGDSKGIDAMSYAKGFEEAEREKGVFKNYRRVVERVNSKKDFLGAIREVSRKRKIDFFLPVVHGSPYSIFFPDSSVLDIFDIKEGLLEEYQKYFNRQRGKNNCYFHSCNVAELREGGFAELFFKALKINGEAPTTTVGMMPLLDKRLRVPDRLEDIYEVRTEGLDGEGDGFYDILFEGVPFHFQAHQGEVVKRVTGYPIGTPQLIVEKFEKAREKGEIPFPNAKEEKGWYYYKSKKARPWRYFENV